MKSTPDLYPILGTFPKSRYGNLPLSFALSALFLIPLTTFGADPAPLASDTTVPPAPPITKTAEDFSGAPWIPSPWNNVGDKLTLDKDVPPGSKSPTSQKVVVNFSGNGDFEHHEVIPPQPLYFPGVTQKIAIFFKTAGQGAAQVNFIDGWGRSNGNDGQPMVWYPKLDPNSKEWTSATFDVPATWVQPIGIEGMTSHNYDFKTEKRDQTYWIGDIVVQSDFAEVDMATGDLKTWQAETSPADKDKALKKVPATPLVTVAFSMGVEGNIFSDTPPQVNLRVGNLKPGTLTGLGTFTVTDQAGKPMEVWTKKITVDSSASFHHDIKAPQYGLYTLKASLDLSDGTKFNTTNTFARVPVQKELSEEQKMISPYGMDVHAAANKVHFYAAFKRAGIYWYRDYAFPMEWLLRAKGADRRYAGWPGYQSIMGDYLGNGLVVLPILKSITPPKPNVAPGPDNQWTRDIADVILSFPTIKYWEIDNEYEINAGTVERPLGDNYMSYHKKFGELLTMLGDGKLKAVENGRSSIYPEDTERMVKNGSFNDIAVVNFHHYAGTDAPETNVHEYNSGDHTDDDVKGNFFDTMRATKKAAQSDGKKREAWLTEFGWDTKAGPIVSAEQQAAYLQRGFLLAFAAGVDRAFWYDNFDENKSAGIFDGCGLFTFDHQPKLSFSSFAALTSILPRPVYVGRINSGPNTWGYVFENDGTLVAGLWSLEGKAPKATFKTGQLSDYLGNKIEGLSSELTIAPIYNVGLSKEDPFYLQTAYEITTPLLTQSMPGETGKSVITVTNNRDKPIQANVKIELPKGWTSPKAEMTATVAPGQHEDLPFSYTVNLDEPVGNQTVSYACQESGTAIKTISSTIVVPQPYVFTVSSITGAPGKTTVTASVRNRTSGPLSGQLHVKIPGTWQTSTPTIEVKDIPAGETKTIPVEMTWSADWKADETATISFQPPNAKGTEKPIIPGQYHLRKAAKINVDGDLKDWPADAQFSNWILGSSAGAPNAKVWMAWAPEGLYGAVDVSDSRIDVTDPKTFWTDDCLEFFVSTRATATPEAKAGDHHFWIVPLLKENRAYLGQWKIKDEIEATQYDIPGFKSALKKTETGYLVEFLIPAAFLKDYKPTEGSQLGLNINFTVHGHHDNRAVYWPESKANGVIENPTKWGRVILTP